MRGVFNHSAIANSALNEQVKKKVCSKFRPENIQVQKGVCKFHLEKINIFKRSIP